SPTVSSSTTKPWAPTAAAALTSPALARAALSIPVATSASPIVYSLATWPGAATTATAIDNFGTLGIGYGGAILNTGLLTVTGSTFRHNQAIGGNNNVSARFSGEGTGGAIGSGGPGGPLAVLIVSGSSFDHNVAVGGNGNKVTPPTQSP